jgi:hypothetical protein
MLNIPDQAIINLVSRALEHEQHARPVSPSGHKMTRIDFDSLCTEEEVRQFEEAVAEQANSLYGEGVPWTVLRKDPAGEEGRYVHIHEEGDTFQPLHVDTLYMHAKPFLLTAFVALTDQYALAYSSNVLDKAYTNLGKLAGALADYEARWEKRRAEKPRSAPP